MTAMLVTICVLGSMVISDRSGVQVVAVTEAAVNPIDLPPAWTTAPTQEEATATAEPPTVTPAAAVPPVVVPLDSGHIAAWEAVLTHFGFAWSKTLSGDDCYAAECWAYLGPSEGSVVMLGMQDDLVVDMRYGTSELPSDTAFEMLERLVNTGHAAESLLRLWGATEAEVLCWSAFKEDLAVCGRWTLSKFKTDSGEWVTVIEW